MRLDTKARLLTVALIALALLIAIVGGAIIYLIALGSGLPS